MLRLETACGDGMSVVTFRLDRDEMRTRLATSRRLLERLRVKDSGGNLEL